MSDLAAAFAGLVRHHVATPARPLPDGHGRGIAYVWAANGTFKYGADDRLEALVPMSRAERAVPGLAALVPMVRWRRWRGRLPGTLLANLLAHAQRAGAPLASGIIHPIEQQYFLIEGGGWVRLIAPADQDASAVRVRYQVPEGAHVLADIHSHAGMPAFFSGTDDADDSGLGVSCVVGNIFSRPTILCRICVWGERHVVPALTIFDSLGPLEDGAARWHGGLDAIPLD